MSEQLKFMGVWHPGLGAFPVVPNDVDSCYYLVADNGEVGGYQFVEGDWLIYVEEYTSPDTAHGKWYRSAGGIVQVGNIGGGTNPVAADPGEYTKIKVNNAGIVTEGGYLEGRDIPTHYQDASTIEGLAEKVKEFAGEAFTNTTRSKAVEFDYDQQTKSLSADVKIDGVTIVKDEFGNLKVADDFLDDDDDDDDDDNGRRRWRFGNNLPRMIAGILDGNDDLLFPPAEHTHSTDDINDFQDKVRQALAHDVKGQNPFFSNTARSNAVAFNYDLKTSTVSADVKIDNTTIVKNQFGQLVAIAADMKPHKHDASDILGLDIDLQPAGDQPVGIPSDGGFADGLYDLKTYRISDAFDVVNVSLKDLTSTLEELDIDIDAIRPVEPPKCSDMVMEIDPSIEFYEAKAAGTGADVLVTFDRTPFTKATERFGTGHTGTLTALVDNQPLGSVTLTDDNNEGIYGALQVAENVDYFEGQPAFQNWYTSARALVAVNDNLEDGLHTFTIEHSETGRARELAVYVSEPSAAPIISTNTRFDLLPPMTKYRSGVPCASSSSYIISNVEVQQAVKSTYNDAILKVSTKDFDIVDADVTDPDDAEANTYNIVNVSEIPAINGYAYSETVPLEIDNDYDEVVSFYLQGLNLIQQAGPEYELIAPNIRIDEYEELNRVQTGSGENLFPDDFGGEWDPTKNLITDYPAELQKVGSEYKWPGDDYTTYGGPDYRNASGVRVIGSNVDDPGYRWVTVKYPVENLIAFDLHIVRTDSNEDWPQTINREIKDMLVFAKCDTTGWVNANKPFVGYGGVSADNDGALDVSKTDNNIRRVTFGAGVGPLTGDLYIRIGIRESSGYRFSHKILVDVAGD